MLHTLAMPVCLCFILIIALRWLTALRRHARMGFLCFLTVRYTNGNVNNTTCCHKFSLREKEKEKKGKEDYHYRELPRNGVCQNVLILFIHARRFSTLSQFSRMLFHMEFRHIFAVTFLCTKLHTALRPDETAVPRGTMLGTRQRRDTDGRAPSMETVHGSEIRILRALLHQWEEHIREDLADGERFDTLQSWDQLYVHLRNVQGVKS